MKDRGEGSVRGPDDLREQLANVLHEHGRAQPALMRRARPRLRPLEECDLGSARRGPGHAEGALVVVGLARAVVAVPERVSAALEDVEPERAGFGGAEGEGVGFGENAWKTGVSVEIGGKTETVLYRWCVSRWGPLVERDAPLFGSRCRLCESN